MWYVVIYSNGKACTHRDRPHGGLYDSVDKCCDEEFNETTSGSGSGGDACRRINICFNTEEPTPTPTSYQ